MTNWSIKIRQQKFDDSKGMVPAILFGNAILFMFLVVFHATNPLVNVHLISLAITILFFLGLHKIYDWKNQSINIGILFFYLLLFALEFGIAGLPETYLSNGYNGIKYGKGMMFDLLIGIYPLSFCLLRLALALPILGIIVRRKALLT